nr:hypothetical protein [Paenibacillus macerans]
MTGLDIFLLMPQVSLSSLVSLAAFSLFDFFASWAVFALVTTPMDK